jgi:diguanylate cyclase (GGDEF)-like protein
MHSDGIWALAQPFVFPAHPGRARGAVAVVRRDRPFREDEEAVMRDLIGRAQEAAAGIVLHQALREQALTDSLTRLGNRRKLAADLDERIPLASMARPLALVAFDLDGFKSYNDTFGHQAGDALLSRLGSKLATAVSAHGAAYRLGGDEFCVLIGAPATEVDGLVAAATGALEESGENFAVRASHGVVLIPKEAANLDYAMQLADTRMYAHKRGRPSSAGDQTREALVRIVQARQPELMIQAGAVAELCLALGRRLGMTGEQLDELGRAAELHDIGRVGIPDAILQKPGPLSDEEWAFVRQHTVLGERILSAAPALRPVARIVRATHERWDGQGYPDGIEGEEIPAAARIIAVCDAYGAITSERPYRPARDHDAACGELRRCAGTQFDPAIVELLLAVLADGAPRAMAARDTRAPQGVPDAQADGAQAAETGAAGTSPADAALARLARFSGSTPPLDAGAGVKLQVP